MNDEKFGIIIEKHIKRWQELGTQIQNLIEPVHKWEIEMQKSIEPMINFQNNSQKSFEHILKHQIEWAKAFNSVKLPQINLPDLTSFQRIGEDIRKSIDGAISPALADLQRSFRELPPRTQEALLLLGEHGWYFDLDMSFPSLWKLKEALALGNVTEAEDTLIEYFEYKLDEIETSLNEKFPSRKKIISNAFKAHRRKEYDLSIPVFLAQADGICKEVVNMYFFRRQDKMPQTANYVKQITTDSLQAALLSPLAQNLPIAASKNERNEGFSELNRHMVLHGESLDYGTLVNSLKAISLVNYLSGVLDFHND